MESISALEHRRRSLRRSVDVDAELTSQWWDGPVALSASDLSPYGLWIDSDLALAVGEEVEVAFTPPRWQGLPRLQVRARVARVSLLRRRADSGRAGMGLAFDDLPPITRRCLEYALRGLPPRLPMPRQEAPRDDLALCLDDGTAVQFHAEAALLSAARPNTRVRWSPSTQVLDSACRLASGSAGLVLWRTCCEREMTVSSSARARWASSPMSAIFDCSPRSAQPANS